MPSNRNKTPIKTNKNLNIFKPIPEGEELCPLTIGSIIVLKAQIIELKQSNCRLHE